MSLLSCRVSGTGVSLPSRVVHSEEVARLCGITGEEAIRRSGVITRHWLSEHEDPLDLGIEAAESALVSAGLSIGNIDVVINASATPLRPIPDGGSIIAAALGLPQGGYAYSIHGTCLSFLLAFREAAFLVSSGRAENVLVVSAEGGSRGLNFDQLESSLLIGDAAAAVVVSRSSRSDQGIASSQFLLDTKGIRSAEIRGGGSRLPAASSRGLRTDYQFDMDGMQLMGGALRVLPRFLESIEPGLSKGAPSVDRVVPHQTSRAGIELMAKLWSPEKVVVTLPELGNTIAASIPAALHRARIAEGERLLLVGTGAGTLYGGLIYQH